MNKIAIIGAGLSGLTLALRLQKTHDITLFEKSRGIGGRMATRYAGDYEFDHGAQYFTAKSKAFQTFLEPYVAQGIVKDWQPKLVTISQKGVKPRISGHPSYVAAPRMNTLAKTMAQGLNIRGETHIAKFEGVPGEWRLVDKTGHVHGPFDSIVTAIPSHQVAQLVPQSIIYHEEMTDIKMDACFSLMLGFEEAFNPGFDGAFVEESPIGWMSVNSSKPDRPQGFSMMVQSTNQWAEQHVDDDKQEVMDRLIAEASNLTGHDLTKADHKVIHRWLYASTSRPGSELFFHDERNAVSSIGDWCIRGRVEAAFESATALADKIEQGV